jgi:hypothetical protein
MNSCENCGHSSHCGTPYYRQHEDYDGRCYSVEICKHCRCNNCEKKDKEDG